MSDEPEVKMKSSKKFPFLLLFFIIILIIACGVTGLSLLSSHNDTPDDPAGPSNQVTPGVTPIPEPAESDEPDISKIPFTIPGRTTIIPLSERSTETFTETYGPLNIMQSISEYTMMTFQDPVPDKGAEVISLTFTIYGETYTRIMKNMHMSGGNPDIVTYSGRINKSDENTQFFITVGPGNLLITDFPWKKTWIDVIPVQNNEYTKKTQNPIHIAYAYNKLLSTGPTPTPDTRIKENAWILELKQIHDGELDNYEQKKIIHLGEQDFSRVPELRELVKNPKEPVRTTYDTYRNIIYPDYMGNRSTFVETDGTYYRLAVYETVIFTERS